jgi:peptidoglycan hydrolase-like protein with peptidoglycan-binding domain
MMTYPILRRGDFGEEVARLQSHLNKAGAMLSIDDDFGPATERGVKYAQDAAGHAVTGVADTGLWEWLVGLDAPFALLHTRGVAYIAQKETGGLGYYDINTKWPHFPGHDSGITIGVGYDLRFNSTEGFQALWGPYLPDAHIRELSKDIGKKGSRSREKELKKMGITVPFKAAWPIFIEQLLPDYYRRTQGIYPSLERLPDLCRSVLVSLVFNRGTSLKKTDHRRREMRLIQTILAQADQAGLSSSERKSILVGVEDQIISMKRLWKKGSGLIERRQEEANLWREGLRKA